MAEIAHASATDTTRRSFYGDTDWHTVTGATISSASLVAGKKYLVIASCQLSGYSKYIHVGGRLAHGAAPTVFTDSATFQRPAVTNYFYCRPYFYFTVWTAAAGEDLIFQVKTESSGNPVYADTTSIFAMQIEELTEDLDWFYQEDTTDRTLTTTEQTVATITFTPGASGDDWLILANPVYDVNGNAQNIVYRVLVDAAEKTRISQEGITISEVLSWGLCLPQNSLSGSVHNVSLRGYMDDTGGDAVSLSSRLLVLRMGAFDDHDAYLQSGSTAVGTSYVTLGTLTATPGGAAHDYLMLGHAPYQHGSISAGSNVKFVVGGTETPLGVSTQENTHIADPTDYAPSTMLAVPNVADGGTTTVTWQANSDAAGGFIHQHAAAIISLELSAGASPITLTPDPVTIPTAVPQPTLSFGGITLSPAPVTVPTALPVPTLSHVLTLSPAPIAVATAFPDPTVTLGGKTLTPDPIAIELVLPLPNVSIGGTAVVLTPLPVAVATAVPQPTVTLGDKALTPTPVVVATAIPQPTLELATTLSPTPVTVPLVVVTPDIEFGGLTLSPAPVTIPLALPLPSVEVSGVAVGTFFHYLIATINTADYPATATFRFRCVLRTDSIDNPVTAYLYNSTIGQVIAGSGLTSTSTEPENLESRDLTLTSGSNEYRCWYEGVPGHQCWCHYADIKVTNA